MSRKPRPSVTRCRRPTLFGVPVMAMLVMAPLYVPPAARAETAPSDQAAPVVALLAKVIPTVVAIETRRNVTAADAKPDSAPKIQRADGSGFIVSPDGLIATNKHVVHGAYAINVFLHDGRTIQAKVVWESTIVDVAFLKIEAPEPLQAARLARDDKLQLGRRVVAIGNPQGLGISASAGIVSALDRNLSLSPYDSYVQTDAAINYGNSGGPLFDLDGEVVGMNSILWTAAKNSGSEGLGFAIPGGDIFFLIEQLKKTGRIACGTIGLRGQKMTPGLADALGFARPFGVIVASLEDESAAMRAGMKMGDIIETFDGKPLPDVTTLNRATCLALGHPAAIDVWRDGKSLSLEVRATAAEDGRAGAGEMNAAPRFASAHDLGLELAPVDDAARKDRHMKQDADGFVVRAVAESSEAENAGLGPGDVITSIQRRPLSSKDSFDRTFANYGRNGPRHVILLVHADSGDRWVTLPVRLSGK